MNYRRVFVTVGTTEFDSLIETLCKIETVEALLSLGCSQVKIQYGNGILHDFSNLISKGIIVESFKMKPNILDDIRSADLVISHAGAGSCIEVLREGKPLVVVVNEELMANHQTELARQLYKEEFLFYCVCKTLAKTLLNSKFNTLKPYVRGDMNEFIKNLDLLMGLS